MSYSQCAPFEPPGIDAISKANTIFLSYSSEDAPAARRIRDALRSAGLEVWFDQGELRGGDAWDASIRDQIKQCAAFIPIISASTQVREEGYFRLEWKLAIDRSHLMAEDKPFLFPVVIDETHESMARVPEKFRQFQWTRLNDPASTEAFATHVRDLMFRDRQPEIMSLQAPVQDKAKTPGERATSATDAGFWVAVLPFKCHGSDPDLESLAEGFAEDISIGLSRFSYLRVVAHAATLGITSAAGDVRDAGKKLKARFLMLGSLRRAGTAIRVSAQLVDTRSGVSLWAEHYDRQYDKESAFELQDELVPRIVSTIADMNGVLPRSLNEVVRDREPGQLNPYEAVLRSFGYFWRLTPEEFNSARAGLESALEKAPFYADAWAMLALLCVQAHGQRFGPDFDFLGMGESAARKAVDLAPSNHMSHFSLAQALFFKKEYESFRNAAYKAAALNPMDGNTLAFLGELLAYSGELARGEKLATQAKQLNPHHPGWYWFTDFFLAFRRGDYRQAVSYGLRINLPEHWANHFMLASAYGWLGEASSAASALAALLELRPDCAANLHADLARWFPPEHAERLMEGLRKAGLQVG